MIVVEYQIFDDQPAMNAHGEYIGVLPAYGYTQHVETDHPIICVSPSECVWIVPGTCDSEA